MSTLRGGGLCIGLGCRIVRWADRTVGLSGFYANQVVPTGDLKSIAFFETFERAIYTKV